MPALSFTGHATRNLLEVGFHRAPQCRSRLYGHSSDRSDSFGAKDAKQEKAWREAYAEGNALPTDQEKLLPFLDLYDKIKRRGMLEYSSAERFVPQGSQGRSMKKLNFIRNEFVHFTPKGWVLELSGAPRIAIDCLDVAEFLVKLSNRFMIFTSFKEGEMLGLIEELKKGFAAIE